MKYIQAIHNWQQILQLFLLDFINWLCPRNKQYCRVLHWITGDFQNREIDFFE
jgi:hypothetical protein